MQLLNDLNCCLSLQIMFTSKGDPLSHDHITPHRLSLLILIKSYTDICDGKNEYYPRMVWVNDLTSKRNLDRFLLSWIQQPDGSYKNVVRAVASCSKVLCSSFTDRVDDIRTAMGGIDDPINCIDDFIQKFSIGLFEDKDSSLHKRGLFGQFSRRMLVYYERLSFCEIQPFFESFVKYCQVSLKKSISEKLNEKHKKSDMSSDAVAIDDMDLESQSEMDSKSSRGSLDPELKPSDLKSEKCDDFDSCEYLTQQQADNFFSQQASLIEGKESDALSPCSLQIKIRQLLLNNPELTQAHYISYLNNLRVKEFSGAMDSLFMYFISNNTKNESKCKETDECMRQVHRFAALNLALLHLKFGHTKAALASAKEAISLAQVSNDHVCLQHAMSILNHLQPVTNQHKVAEEVIKPAKKRNLMDLAFTAVQTQMKKQAYDGERPSVIFRALVAADALQCTRPLPYLLSMSYSHRASLWRMYGKRHFSLLYCQMSLSLQKTTGKKYQQAPLLCHHNPEDASLTMSHLVEMLLEEGHQNASTELLNHTKVRFSPNSPHSMFWRISEARILHKSSLRLLKYAEASQAETVLHSFDKQEALYCQAKNLYTQGENLQAHSALMQLLQMGKDNHIHAELKCKVYILLGDLLSCNVNQFSSSSKYYLESLALADANHLQILVIETYLKLAQLQLHSGSAQLALNCVRCVSQRTCADSDVHLRSKFVLITIKCLLKAKGKPSLSELNMMISNLLQAQSGFEDSQDLSRRRDTSYLLAILYNEKLVIVNSDATLKQRNDCASEFRQLDAQLGSVKCALII